MKDASSPTIRFLTMAPGGGSSAPNFDDSGLDRDPIEQFRAVGDVQEPDRQSEEATKLLEHVWRVAQAAARHTDAIAQLTYELSLPQLLAIRAILAAEAAGRAALSVSDLAIELQCSRANASELAAALVRRRWLTKGRDAANRRVVRLFPTPDGRVGEFHAGALVDDCARRVFGQLPAAERRFLLALLEKVTFAAPA